MINHEINSKMMTIDHHRNSFNKFVVQAKKILTKLHETLSHPELSMNTTEIIDNSFQFSFWGQNFIIKTEIMFDVVNKSFIEGELNTYHENNDEFNLILTYKFDSIGNIADRLLIEEFSYFYYTDLFPSIVEYSKKSNIKFQLK